ncbi:MAG: zf-TFIIB domain-containing protein [Acidobacteriota bacterium]
MHRRDFTGEHWNTARLRRVREFGWFRNHERELIERARESRRKRDEAARASLAERASAALEGPALSCPRCRKAMIRNEISGAAAQVCTSCSGVFLDLRELELLLLRHDAEKRWFFRSLDSDLH